MGEFAVRKTDGRRVKIGTCASMYYLRYEDRDNMTAQDDSLDPANTDGLYWRIPFPDEDDVAPGCYVNPFRGERLWKTTEEIDGQRWTADFVCPELADNPGTIQLRHESGLLVNIPCHHGERLPDLGGVRVFWNGRTHSYELAHVKNDGGRVLPVIKCRHCLKQWTTEWANVLPYLHGELKRRLEKHAD